VMIDTLVRLLPRAQKSSRNGLPDHYALVTLHRPSNVDDLSWLSEMLRALADLSQELHVIFPVHPRTRLRMAELDLHGMVNHRLCFLEPKPYIEFLALLGRATVVITDSGGIQEETTFLNVPCLTVRENTERPITVTLGTNQVIGRDIPRLQTAVRQILAGNAKKASPVPLWDGHAAERIASAILAI
jgi:UDP-N-acetylglucosamine 2-epimerase (non-hydrolysing)